MCLIKVKTPSRRVKGTFCSKGMRLMVPDARKKFRLLSSDGGRCFYE